MLLGNRLTGKLIEWNGEMNILYNCANTLTITFVEYNYTVKSLEKIYSKLLYNYPVAILGLKIETLQK